MSLFAKVQDTIVRKDNVVRAFIKCTSFAEKEEFTLVIDTSCNNPIMIEYETLKQARFALNKLHRELEGEIESW